MFVDTSDVWPRAIEWLGRFMALVRGEAYDPQKARRASADQRSDRTLSRQTCGVKYCEALRSMVPNRVTYSATAPGLFTERNAPGCSNAQQAVVKSFDRLACHAHAAWACFPVKRMSTKT